jgi:hypothetical protein
MAIPRSLLLAAVLLLAARLQTTFGLSYSARTMLDPYLSGDTAADSYAVSPGSIYLLTQAANRPLLYQTDMNGVVRYSLLDPLDPETTVGMYTRQNAGPLVDMKRLCVWICSDVPSTKADIKLLQVDPKTLQLTKEVALNTGGVHSPQLMFWVDDDTIGILTAAGDIVIVDPDAMKVGVCHE